MRLLLADVEVEPLEDLAAKLERDGHEVVVQETDVSDRDAVFRLAETARRAFGPIHVLCNNAGVATPSTAPVWETSEQDWRWVLDVNLMGVVYGIQAFVPAMLEYGDEGHIVNTASIMGLLSGRNSAYAASKHAVVRLSEALFHDLRDRESKLGVSVLCPGLVATRIVEAGRNRPDRYRSAQQADADPTSDAALAEYLRATSAFFRDEGMSPDEVAAILLEAIAQKTFYVLTHPGYESAIEARLQNIVTGRDPADPRGYS